MKPYFEDSRTVLHQGDALSVLRELPSGSVQTCVTSPPYWGLRSYGVEPMVWGGDVGDACPSRAQLHEWGEEARLKGEGRAGGGIPHMGDSYSPRAAGQIVSTVVSQGAFCRLCGAWKGCLGLEPTPELFVEHIVAVFREVRRVLRDDGTVWLNLGDSYAGSVLTRPFKLNKGVDRQADLTPPSSREVPNGLKPKDLCGIPWMVAFALRADGWVLRSDVVWSKSNPMPESVQDRPTRAHEMVFLLSKAKWIGSPPRRFADISDQDARWLALFLDTEGNVVVKRSAQASGRTTYGAQICFASTHRGLLEEAQRIIGAGVVAERKGFNAPMFYLQLSNRQAADLLHRVYPYLIVKPRQAALAIYLQTVLADSDQDRKSKAGQLRGRGRADTYTAKLEEMWQAMKSLNHFGDPDISWVPTPAYGRWTSQPYYYDADAIREPHGEGTVHGDKYVRQVERQRQRDNGAKPSHFDSPEPGVARFGSTTADRYLNPAGRNKRSVWEIATQSFPGSHFATFPEELVKPCILAGTSEQGQCAECGVPWRRVMEREAPFSRRNGRSDEWHTRRDGVTRDSEGSSRTIGWLPTCKHRIGVDVWTGPQPQAVLDPFAGSGTVGVVARKAGRKAVLIELNPDYCELAANRFRQAVLL